MSYGDCVLPYCVKGEIQSPEDIVSVTPEDQCPESVGPDLPTPTDPDGDGFHEDVNGNGRIDFGDLTLLFDNMDDPPVQDCLSQYDLNENGRVDFGDLIEIYEKI